MTNQSVRYKILQFFFVFKKILIIHDVEVGVLSMKINTNNYERLSYTHKKLTLNTQTSTNLLAKLQSNGSCLSISSDVRNVS